MIRFVPMGQLRPGAVVARAIYGYNGDALFRPGSTLSGLAIRRLAALGCPGVYVRDLESSLPDVTDLVSDATRTAVINRLWHTFRELEHGNRLQYAPLFNSVHELLQDVLADSNVLVNLSDLRSHDGYTFGHSVNVAAMSLVIGYDLGFSFDQLRTLGLGALLHDIGKIGIPGETLRQRGPLTNDQWRLVQEHPRLGFEILRHYYEFSLAIAHIAYQHHERLDGSGYPRGLKGDAIHQYARIVAVVDVFDAMRSERVYRPGVPVHKVLEQLQRGRGTKFAPEVVDSLLRRVAPYPVGTTVRLSNGEVGVVTAVPPGARDRPTVTVLFDAAGTAVDGKLVRELADDIHIRIERVLPALGKDQWEGEAQQSVPAG